MATHYAQIQTFRFSWMSTRTMHISAIEHHRIETNGITLHVVQAGPLSGPVIILLHGFPEFWMAWSEQIDSLVEAGYRVWLPDQRGYNLSDKPQGIDQYRIDVLARDVAGLIEASGRSKVYLAGHDWGGAVSWHLAQSRPDLLEALIVVNCPRLEVLQYQLERSSRQRLKSWYILFFQIPRLPEYLLSRRNHQGLVRALRSTSRRGVFPDAVIQKYRESWAQPGALNAMLNWYRARSSNKEVRRSATRIVVRTLLIWGKQDTALGSEMAHPSIAVCEQGELAFIENASHWVLREEPAQVNRLMLEFLQTGPTTTHRPQEPQSALEK
jgi:pimeloyl-ACP methyl ester carboxylesterase